MKKVKLAMDIINIAKEYSIKYNYPIVISNCDSIRTKVLIELLDKIDIDYVKKNQIKSAIYLSTIIQNDFSKKKQRVEYCSTDKVFHFNPFIDWEEIDFEVK